MNSPSLTISQDRASLNIINRIRRYYNFSLSEGNSEVTFKFFPSFFIGEYTINISLLILVTVFGEPFKGLSGSRLIHWGSNDDILTFKSPSTPYFCKI